MSRQAKAFLAYVSVVPLAFGALVYLLDSRYPTQVEAQVVEEAVVTLQNEMVELRRASDVQYDRVICELEAIRTNDNRVCR